MFKQILQKLIPSFLVSWYHFLWAFFGALYYGFPSRKFTVIGVTGTHGKTTTANLAGKILETAGYRVALASSINFRIAGKEQENKFKMTMPGRAFLQKFLKQAVKAGCQYAILEATSEGILQHRHRFIKFDVMVFTNLYKEHLERHGGFENYKKAKGKYFQVCKNLHILNIDDQNVDYFLKFPSRQTFCYGFDGLKIEKLKIDWKLKIENWKFIKADSSHITEEGVRLSVDGVSFDVRLLGGFNAYNVLAAVCIGLSQGVSLETCQKALAGAGGVPGRMEEIISQPIRVVVDYAFTPDALRQVYETLANPKLICVLGACGGGRDKWKRPVLGEIAGKYCDEVIITNEDPYDEDPMEIINQVAQGAKLLLKELSSLRVQEILDRREAIKKSLELARPGDTVIITGKGCEPWICIENGKKIPWDDRKVAREEFKKLNNQYGSNQKEKLA